MCMLVFVFLFLCFFFLECTWSLLWEQVTSWSSWSHDAATDATPQAQRIQLKNTHFHMLQMNFLFKSGALVFFFCQDGSSSLLLLRNNFIAVREWFISMWFAFAGSQFYRDTFLMLVCFTKAKCSCLPCTSKLKVSVWVCQAAALR